MIETHLIILLFALVIDWFAGEPEVIWSRVPHPVVLMGKLVSALERVLHREQDSDALAYKKGALCVSVCIIVAVLVGVLLSTLFTSLGVFGHGLEVIVVFVLLAQRSLHDHVEAIVTGFQMDGLDGARKAVSMIVGRDPGTLDEPGVARAGIESLAENFSDGVVAPAFWYAVFGLPGLLAYKMINTADSMIGYKNEKFLWFGRVAAQIDDIANWLPARLSVIAIALGATVARSWRAGISALDCAFRDAGLHASPNAGWPEAAMAGALGIALGGPRDYGETSVSQSHINAAGTQKLSVGHIAQALRVFTFACFALWGFVLLAALML